MRFAYSGQCTSVTADATDRAEPRRGEGGGGRGGAPAGVAGVLSAGASAVGGSGAEAVRRFFSFFRRRGGSTAASGPGAEAGAPAPAGWAATRRGADFARFFLARLGVPPSPDGWLLSRWRVSLSRDSVTLRAKERAPCPLEPGSWRAGAGGGVVVRRLFAGLLSGSTPRVFVPGARRRSAPARRRCCVGPTFGRAARVTPDDGSVGVAGGRCPRERPSGVAST